MRPSPLPAALLLPLMVGCSRPDPSLEPIAPYDPIPLVNPFIGTGGLGARLVGLNPGATTPFGLVQVGPDTRHTTQGQLGFYHFGGYHYDDDLIDGFAHTHANGMGVNDYGGVHVMARTHWDDRYVRPTPRAAPFSHDTEVARPGSFEVRFDDDGTHVELAATPRGAIHRYTFAEPGEPVVLFDLGYKLGNVTIDGAWLTRDGATVEGFQLLRGGYSTRVGGLPHHFVATFEPAPVASGVWTDVDEPVPGEAVEGTEAGMWVRFPSGTSQVTMRIALSPTGIEGARANHRAEVVGRSLEQAREAAEDRWREALGRVRVRGGTDEERVIFHTALYRAMIWPQAWDDADGTYVGFDGELHVDPRGFHSAFSLWDTFRTVHPLLTLIDPDQHERLLDSLLRMAEQGGDLPRWPIGSGYTGGMAGSPGAIVLAEAALKGLDLGDEGRAFEHAVAAALEPRANAGRSDIDAWRNLGWIPADEVSGAATRTIEYAWADHALALWARAIGRDDLTPTLSAQADQWRNTWDPVDRFFLGRLRDGSFNRRYNPLAWSGDFIEGTAWHYRYGVFHDVPGMIDVQNDGDADAFLRELQDFWDIARLEDSGFVYESYYWHGNEPPLHYGFVGSLAGDHAMSAEQVHWIRQSKYSTAPDGLNGNDDAGTLSSWYIFASMGLYPIAGTPTYALASPIWERVEIGDLVIRREGDGVVPSQVRLGDEPLPAPQLDHRALIDAGELVFVQPER